MAANNQKALELAGLSTLQMFSFQTSIEENKAVNALATRIGKDASLSDSTKENFLTALGRQWKSDRTVFARMEADLNANPQLANQIVATAKADPQKAISAIGQYKGGDMASLLADAPSIATTAPAAATPAAPAPTTTTARPAPAATAPAALAAGPAAPADNSSDEMTDDQLDKFLSNPDSIKLLAATIADGAKTKFGVNAATADGFVKKIESNPRLVQDISDNLKRNPGLVRAMFKAAKDDTPMKGIAKHIAQQEMNRLMANPELLASDKFAKETQRNIQLAEDLKNGNFGQLQSMMGPLRSGFASLDSIGAGFSGELQVITVSPPGKNSLFPNVMINRDNYRENARVARNDAAYGAGDMTALPLNGSKFKTVVEKGPDGKDIQKQVPNTGEFRTASGEKVDIIPSVGVLKAIQRSGAYDASGKFYPGDVRVPVITAVDAKGDASKLRFISMAPDEFERYRAWVNKAAQEAGNTRTLGFTPYTQSDAIAAGKGPAIQVTRVDAQTGVAAPPVPVYPAAPQIIVPNNNGVTAHPVRPDGPVETRELTVH